MRAGGSRSLAASTVSDHRSLAAIMRAGAATLPGMEIEIVTGAGPARVNLDKPGNPRFLLVLTHGAGGGTDSKDLLAARQAGLDLGGAVARVLQPYRVRGARAPGSADRQDAAWVEIIKRLRRRFRGIPLVQGGRSNGARVACRTAQMTGARAVVALAFPLHPPGQPERSRVAELRAAGTDVIVVNGDRDPFGIPGPADASRVVVLPGETHTLSRHPEKVREAVAAWLGEVLNVASERGDDPPSTHERADGASAGTRGRAGMYSRGADPANV